MKPQHVIITMSFLQRLQKQAKNEQHQSPVHPAFKNLLDKEELMSIIDHMFDGEAEMEYPDLKIMSKDSLLEAINDEYYILCWLIEEVLGSYTL